MSEGAIDSGPVLVEAEDDDLPDFSGDDWAVKIGAVGVKRGRNTGGGFNEGPARPG